jgi:hypothetical protein
MGGGSAKLAPGGRSQPPIQTGEWRAPQNRVPLGAVARRDSYPSPDRWTDVLPHGKQRCHGACLGPKSAQGSSYGSQ